MRIVPSIVFPFFICILIWCVSTISLKAQQDSVVHQDHVFLKDGSKLIGTIRKWDYEHAIYLVLNSGAEVMIPKADILKVQQMVAGTSSSTEGLSPHERMKLKMAEMKARPYAFREKGFYGTATIGINPNFFGSASFIGSFGYRFNRFVSAGVATGIDLLNDNRSQRFIPVLAELRGFPLKKKISPFYAVKAGYIIPVYNQFNDGIANATGGFNGSAEIGVRFGDRRVNYILGIEFQLASAQFEYRFPWDETQVTYDDLLYRRINFRTGIQF